MYRYLYIYIYIYSITIVKAWISHGIFQYLTLIIQSKGPLYPSLYNPVYSNPLILYPPYRELDRPAILTCAPDLGLSFNRPNFPCVAPVSISMPFAYLLTYSILEPSITFLTPYSFFSIPLSSARHQKHRYYSSRIALADQRRG